MSLTPFLTLRPATHFSRRGIGKVPDFAPQGQGRNPRKTNQGGPPNKVDKVSPPLSFFFPEVRMASPTDTLTLLRAAGIA